MKCTWGNKAKCRISFGSSVSLGYQEIGNNLWTFSHFVLGRRGCTVNVCWKQSVWALWGCRDIPPLLRSELLSCLNLGQSFLIGFPFPIATSSLTTPPPPQSAHWSKSELCIREWDPITPLPFVRWKPLYALDYLPDQASTHSPSSWYQLFYTFSCCCAPATRSCFSLTCLSLYHYFLCLEVLHHVIPSIKFLPILQTQLVSFLFLMSSPDLRI